MSYNVKVIDTLGYNNSCFIHSLLHSYDKYIEGNEEEKVNFAEKFRLEILSKLKEENPKYTTLESVIQLVNNYFNFEKNHFEFINFLRIAYSFDASYLEPPDSLISYKIDKYDIEDYKKYLSNYREYLINYQKKLNNFSHPKFVYSAPKISMVPLKDNKDLEEVYKVFTEEITKFYKFCEDKNKKIIEKYRLELEKIITKEILYNPQNFGPKVIEAYIEKNNFIPKGKYHYLAFNCYYFTINNGANLIRFDESNGANFEKINHIITGKRFFSDDDIIPMIPELFNINIIILNRRARQLINHYEYSEANKYICINNEDNTHFDALCLKSEDDTVYTLFDKKDSFIQTILSSKENKGKLPDNIIF
jgi:hypothetical protein